VQNIYLIKRQVKGRNIRMKTQVTVIGGLNMDIKAKSKKDLVSGDSNPSDIEISAGGVGRNIAHNLALLDLQSILLSAVGDDIESHSVIAQTAQAGVNMEHLMISNLKKTGKYIAILDSQGEMSMAVSDMGILEVLDTDYLESKLELIKSSQFVVCDTNVSVDCLKFIIESCKIYNIPLCIDPVSAAKAIKLKGLLEGIDILTPNALELQVLTGIENNVEKASKELIHLGVKNVIATLGPKGLCHTDKNKSTYFPSIAKSIVDVTGAGDSLTAGLIYGLLEFKSFELACLCGSAAAAITLSSKETVNSKINKAEITKLIHKL
jgi:pseudouridine kinase